MSEMSLSEFFTFVREEAPLEDLDSFDLVLEHEDASGRKFFRDWKYNKPEHGKPMLLTRMDPKTPVVFE